MGPIVIEGKALTRVGSAHTSKSATNSGEITTSPTSTANDADFQSTIFDFYNRILKWLVFAGLKEKYSSLWELTVKGRSLTVVNDPGLHLTWKDTILYIKPLPDCLGEEGATAQLGTNDNEELVHVRGFFHSYTYLVQSQCDYDIAAEHKLLPEKFLSKSRVDGFKSWRKLADAWLDANPPTPLPVRRNKDPAKKLHTLPGSCHPRYVYGELRLDRLNWIMWVLYLPHYFELRPFKSHFYVTKDPFGKFWEGYGKFIVLVFAYVTTILSAFQVALAAGSMPKWFKDGCLVISYGIILLILGHVVLVGVYGYFWVVNQIWGWVRLQFWRYADGKGDGDGETNSVNSGFF